jgi:sterol desaturase/sphingolipid hydroxylase (fatty acid hydroxylase superfamily)
VDVNAYYALGIPGYLLVIALELALGRRRGASDYGFADSIGNLSAGMGEVLVGLFLGPSLVALYDWAFTHLALVRWAPGAVFPWVLAFFVGDLCYYVYHRAGHRVAVFWAIHGVHHQSERFNVTLAIRHPWLSDSYAAIFYAPLPLLGVTSTQFFLAIAIISFYSLTIHTRIFRRPGFFLLTTPDSHIVHHARNPRYIGRNLGAMFTLWDRIFGTHVEVLPHDPPELGARVGYQTHDGALAQVLFFRDLLHLARQTPALRDKIRVFLGPPGWIPPGASLPVRPPARPEEAIPAATRGYVLAHFTLASLLAVYLLWLRARHPLWLQGLLFLLLVHALTSLGGLLDGRSSARSHELLRLAAWGVVGGVLLGVPGQTILGACLLGAAALGLLWLRAPGLRDAALGAPLAQARDQ